MVRQTGGRRTTGSGPCPHRAAEPRSAAHRPRVWFSCCCSCCSCCSVCCTCCSCCCICCDLGSPGVGAGPVGLGLKGRGWAGEPTWGPGAGECGEATATAGGSMPISRPAPSVPIISGRRFIIVSLSVWRTPDVEFASPEVRSERPLWQACAHNPRNAQSFPFAHFARSARATKPGGLSVVGITVCPSSRDPSSFMNRTRRLITAFIAATAPASSAD
jgi:hypothetical protein